MQPPKFAIFPLLFAVLTGCQSREFTCYTSPEITGRVLAADTRQPLANVTVERNGSGQGFEPFGPPKGGQLIIQPDNARTDGDGRFKLESISVFAVFHQPGWWSVPVACRHSGYETFQTNYTSTNVTSHTDAGAPVVHAGDIFLQPLSR